MLDIFILFAEVKLDVTVLFPEFYIDGFSMPYSLKGNRKMSSAII